MLHRRVGTEYHGTRVLWYTSYTGSYFSFYVSQDYLCIFYIYLQNNMTYFLSMFPYYRTLLYRFEADASASYASIKLRLPHQSSHIFIFTS